MATLVFILLNVAACLIGTTFVAGDRAEGEVEILTATNDFEILAGKAEITFELKVTGNGTVPEVFISKKYPCLDISEPIYMGDFLTINARDGISVTTDEDLSYTMHFEKAQETDKGTYIVSAVKRVGDRYEHITNRSFNLISSDDKDLKEVCNDDCNNTGWKVGFAVVFVLLILVIGLGVFLFIQFLRIDIEQDSKKEEDIYVLRQIGSSSATGPTDTYESMDDTGNRQQSFSNAGAAVDDNPYMIPSEDEAEKEDGGQSSEPEDDAPGIPGTEADDGSYDIPSRALQPDEGGTQDELEAVSDNRASTSDVAPTLPSYYNRPPRDSVAMAASEAAVTMDPYERIRYGKYAKRFERLRRCNIL